MTEGVYSFTEITPYVRILSGTEQFWCGKEALKYDVVSKMIEELNGIQILGKFNHNKIRDILQGFWDKITNKIGG